MSAENGRATVTLPTVQSFQVGNVTWGAPGKLFLIAGPCIIENEETPLRVAEAVSKLCARLDVGFVFKASYDKANRSSITAFRGLGMEEGLRILEKVRSELGCPLLTDIHDPSQVGPVAEVVDAVQVPAFLCRQTDLLVAAAKSGRAVNVKKGQFLAPWDVKNIVTKLVESGCERLSITERGASFGYNNLVSDMRALPVLREMGWPAIFDATHSVQLPGGGGTHTGGMRESIPFLARAAVAAGVDGIFAEVHVDPKSSKSDATTILGIDEIEALLPVLVELKRIVI